MHENFEWPKAYIVGAPKCGTTALAHYLSEHPDVSVAQPKEPGYHSTDLPGLAVVADEGEYASLFNGSEASLKLDASVWYLYSKTAIPNVLNVQSDVKVIAMLRNPLKMLPSLHRQLVQSLDEDVKDFEEAWALSDARAEGNNVPAQCRAPETLVYTRTAAFGEQLERLMEQVDRSDVLVLFQEELARDPKGLYERVLSFLGLRADGRDEFQVINAATGYRFEWLQKMIKRDSAVLQAAAKPIKEMLGREDLGFRRSMDAMNRRAPDRAKLSREVADQIVATYRDDMVLVGKLLGRDLKAEFGWPV